MIGLPEIEQRPKVLTVDDTPANLALIGNILRDDYQIYLANNGVKALELALSVEPDLILLDVMMPGMDGFEICRRLKANPETSQISVIFLTVKAAVEDEELGFELGAVDFIHKPISPPIVKARVRTHLKLKLVQDCLQRENEKLQGDVKQHLAAAQSWRMLAASWAERCGK